MCGRFTLTEDNRERVAEQLGVPAEDLAGDATFAYRPRYNVAPTDLHPIIRMKQEDREALVAKWGLVQFGSKDAKRAAAQINARADTVDSRPAFRNAWRAPRRCAIPADGYFEWVGPKEDRLPIWFHRPDGGIFLFAGLYESWQPTPDTWRRTFTIITTEPNEMAAKVHDRMPVILPEERVDDWLFQGTASDALKTLLVAPPEDFLVATAVSKRANSVRNDDPSCVQPVPYLL